MRESSAQERVAGNQERHSKFEGIASHIEHVPGLRSQENSLRWCTPSVPVDLVLKREHNSKITNPSAAI